MEFKADYEKKIIAYLWSSTPFVIGVIILAVDVLDGSVIFYNIIDFLFLALVSFLLCQHYKHDYSSSLIVNDDYIFVSNSEDQISISWNNIREVHLAELTRLKIPWLIFFGNSVDESISFKISPLSKPNLSKLLFHIQNLAIKKAININYTIEPDDVTNPE